MTYKFIHVDMTITVVSDRTVKAINLYMEFCVSLYTGFDLVPTDKLLVRFHNDNIHDMTIEKMVFSMFVK
jgi:hypothetical protein